MSRINSDPPRARAGAGWAALGGSVVAFGLGNSLEPVSACAWMATPLLVYSWEVLTAAYILPSANLALKVLNMSLLVSAVAVAQGAGFLFGFLSLFAADGQTVATTAAAFGGGMLQWGAVGALCLVPHYLFRQNYPASPASFLVYPATYTTVTHTVIGRIFSSMLTLSNAVTDYQPLRQAAALGGVGSITFVVTALGTALALRAPIPGRRRTSARTLAALGCAFALMMAGTGLLAQADRFYQKDVSSLIHPTVETSCIMAESYSPQSPDAAALWSKTDERLEAGDAIVMWSEEGLSITGENEERDVLARAKASLAGRAPGTLLGITYDYKDASVNYSRNVFVLLQEPGTVLWKYFKSHPVPLVEIGVKPGPSVLPTADVDISGVQLRVGGAVCFDLDYPEFIVQAGQKGVDLLLQPSWTWRALSSRHLDGNSLRSVENGLTIMRCTSDGESGVVDRSGRILQRRFTGHSTATHIPFTVPLVKHKGRTLYVAGGYLFEWVVVMAAVVSWGAVVMIFLSKDSCSCLSGHRRVSNRASLDAPILSP